MWESWKHHDDDNGIDLDWFATTITLLVDIADDVAATCYFELSTIGKYNAYWNMINYIVCKGERGREDSWLIIE